MRENHQSGSEGRGAEANRLFLPLFTPSNILAGESKTMRAKTTLSGIEDVLKECGVTEATLSAAEKEFIDRLG